MSKWLAQFFPELPAKLRTARIPDKPEYYIKKALVSAVFLSLALMFVVFGFVQSVYVLLLLLLTPIFFWYFFHFADVRIIQLGREVDQELTFAGRFIVIEAEAGVPLHQTFRNVARSYEHVGAYFQEVVDKVELGTDMEDAINDVIEYVPSQSLRKMFWQILNSLRTGSEIADSLKVAIDQIVREQRIEVVEYGRKLNPLAMFYMMVAVIFPSLGATMLIVMATFIGFELSLPILLVGAFGLVFVQFMFLAAIRSQRPAVSY